MSVNAEGVLRVAQSHVQRWGIANEVKSSRVKQQRAPSPTNLKDKISVFKKGRCNGGEFISIHVDAAWKKKGKGKQWVAAVGWEEETHQSPRLKGGCRIFAQDA